MANLWLTRSDLYTPVDWWMDYTVWLMLQFKFTLPAKAIGYGDDMETYLKTFSLNGWKGYSICR